MVLLLESNNEMGKRVLSIRLRDFKFYVLRMKIFNEMVCFVYFLTIYT